MCLSHKLRPSPKKMDVVYERPLKQFPILKNSTQFTKAKASTKVHLKGAKSIRYNKSFYPKIVSNRSLHEQGNKFYQKICTKWKEKNSIKRINIGDLFYTRILLNFMDSLHSQVVTIIFFLGEICEFTMIYSIVNAY